MFGKRGQEGWGEPLYRAVTQLYQVEVRVNLFIHGGGDLLWGECPVFEHPHIRKRIDIYAQTYHKLIRDLPQDVGLYRPALWEVSSCADNLRLTAMLSGTYARTHAQKHNTSGL